MPTRNSLPYVRDQIDAILRQTMTDWEVVAVDGHSTDGTWELLMETAATDARFKVRQSPPQGVYAALNECLRHASGLWVLFTMADDTLLPSCLQRLQEVIEGAPDTELIHYKIKIIDAAGRDSDYTWQDRLAVRYWGTQIDRRHWRDGTQEYWRHVLYGSVYISLTELAVRRSLLLTVPPFEEEIGAWADILWAARAVRGRKVLHIPSVLATWRKREGQVTQFGDKSASPRNHLALIEVLRREDTRNPYDERYRTYRQLALTYYRFTGVLDDSGRILRRLQHPLLLLREIVGWLYSGELGAIGYRIRQLRSLIPPE